MNVSFPNSLMIIALFSLSFASGIVAKQEFYAGKPTGNRAFSLLSDHRFLSNCLAGLTTLQARLLAQQNRQVALQKCDSISQNILQTSPHDAYAWFVAAYVNFHLGNEARFNDALGKSYDFASYETWLAKMRIPLAERAFSSLSAANSTSHLNDLNLALNSNTGGALLVSLYMQNPDFRPRISAQLANQPTQIQASFLAALRRNIQGYANGN
ncbi:MAG: hypothetical protein L3J33_01250 [Rhodobacteraceae bacterium]|nr:hypothetical protein [Paracoccaceae bacterium]